MFFQICPNFAHLCLKNLLGDAATFPASPAATPLMYTTDDFIDKETQAGTWLLSSMSFIFLYLPDLICLHKLLLELVTVYIL